MHKRKKTTEGEAILSAIYAIQLELRRAKELGLAAAGCAKIS